MSDEATRVWRLKNPHKLREYQIRHRLKYPEAVLFTSARMRAKQKGLPFDIVKEDIVIPAMCPVLNIPIFANNSASRPKRNGPNSPSLDRIKPELGYVKGNIQVISWRANDLKKDATAAELLAVAAHIQKQDE